MKRLFLLLLVFSMCVQLIACGNNGEESVSVVEESSVESAPVSSEIEESSVVIGITDDSSVAESSVEESSLEESSVAESSADISEESSEPEELIDVDELGQHDKELCYYGDIDVNGEDKEEINKILKEINAFELTEENLSFAVWSIDGKKALTYNTNQEYFTACAIKIAYVYSCCKQIDAGLVDKHTKIAFQEHHMHDGAGDIKDSPIGTEYTIEVLLQKSVSFSDNVAYEMIVEYFGHEYYTKMLEEIGCESLKIPNGRLWCHTALVTEFVSFWNELYTYFESDAPMADDLKRFCTNTVFNYGTLTLDKGVEYSHKSGDNSGRFPAYNDAGIVWAEVPYMYCIFTNTQGVDGNTKTTSAIMTQVHEIMGGNKDK